MAYEQDFRQQSAQYLAQAQWDMAYGTLVDLWNQRPSLATAHYLLTSYERLRQHVPLTPCRFAILRSFTVEPLVPLLQAAAFAHGMPSGIRISARGDATTYSA